MPAEKTQVSFANLGHPGCPQDVVLLHTDTPNFDPLARVYRWMEYLSFGPMLERCRFRFLPRCSQAHHALVLGDGDGRFAARLLAANRAVHVDAIDCSAAMLDVLRRRALRTAPDADARLHTIQTDLRQFSPSGGDYDLVISHFFLDCLTDDEVSALVKRLRPSMAEDAIWLVSEFSIPEQGWQRTGSQLLVRCLYLAFSWMTGLGVQRIPDYAAALTQHGFHRQEQQQFLGGLLVSEIWARNP